MSISKYEKYKTKYLLKCEDFESFSEITFFNSILAELIDISHNPIKICELLLNEVNKGLIIEKDLENKKTLENIKKNLEENKQILEQKTAIFYKCEIDNIIMNALNDQQIRSIDNDNYLLNFYKNLCNQSDIEKVNNLGIFESIESSSNIELIGSGKGRNKIYNKKPNKSFTPINRRDLQARIERARFELIQQRRMENIAIPKNNIGIPKELSNLSNISNYSIKIIIKIILKMNETSTIIPRKLSEKKPLKTKMLTFMFSFVIPIIITILLSKIIPTSSNVGYLPWVYNSGIKFVVYKQIVKQPYKMIINKTNQSLIDNELIDLSFVEPSQNAFSQILMTDTSNMIESIGTIFSSSGVTPNNIVTGSIQSVGMSEVGNAIISTTRSYPQLKKLEENVLEYVSNLPNNIQKLKTLRDIEYTQELLNNLPVEQPAKINADPIAKVDTKIAQ